jgi:hypothetical protein
MYHSAVILSHKNYYKLKKYKQQVLFVKCTLHNLILSVVLYGCKMNAKFAVSHNGKKQRLRTFEIRVLKRLEKHNQRFTIYTPHQILLSKMIN